jgi:hypothetical protein
VTLSISREIVRAARYLLMAIRRDMRPVDSRFLAGASSAESVSWSPGLHDTQARSLRKGLENCGDDGGKHAKQQEGRQEADHQR